MDTFLTLVQLFGLPGGLVAFVLLGFYMGWWRFGREYIEIERDRNWWKSAAAENQRRLDRALYLNERANETIRQLLEKAGIE